MIPADLTNWRVDDQGWLVYPPPLKKAKFTVVGFCPSTYAAVLILTAGSVGGAGPWSEGWTLLNGAPGNMTDQKGKRPVRHQFPAGDDCYWIVGPADILATMRTEQSGPNICERCKQTERIPTWQWIKIDSKQVELCHCCWQTLRAWIYSKRPI